MKKFISAALFGFLIGLLIAMTNSAKADVTFDTVGVHIGSVHSNNNQQWNNSNPGLYGVWRVDNTNALVDGRYVLGTYYNSINQQSYYAGRFFEYPMNSVFSVGVIVGVITGYERSALPMLLPGVSVSLTNNVKARLSVVPKAAKNGAAALHLSMEWKF